jgi:hypothetical protein
MSRDFILLKSQESIIINKVKTCTKVNDFTGHVYNCTPSVPIYKKIFKKLFGSIYKKKWQFLRYIYCLKYFSNPHLMLVFSILVGIFNTSQIFKRVYL